MGLTVVIPESFLSLEEAAAQLRAAVDVLNDAMERRKVAVQQEREAESALRVAREAVDKAQALLLRSAGAARISDAWMY